MADVLAFILANKYILLIGVVSLVVEVLSVTYLARNIKTDFSYSCHEYVWFEGSWLGFTLAVLGFASGVSVLIVSSFYLVV
jgi:hypothetical protein